MSKFKKNDYVFAKVKGYPPWPARITKTLPEKYSVFFFGTSEIANVKIENLFHYLENKAKLVTAKTLKRPLFSKGIELIDKALHLKEKRKLIKTKEAPVKFRGLFQTDLKKKGDKQLDAIKTVAEVEEISDTPKNVGKKFRKPHKIQLSSIEKKTPGRGAKFKVEVMENRIASQKKKRGNPAYASGRGAKVKVEVLYSMENSMEESLAEPKGTSQDPSQKKKRGIPAKAPERGAKVEVLHSMENSMEESLARPRETSQNTSQKDKRGIPAKAPGRGAKAKVEVLHSMENSMEESLAEPKENSQKKKRGRSANTKVEMVRMEEALAESRASQNTSQKKERGRPANMKVEMVHSIGNRIKEALAEPGVTSQNTSQKKERGRPANIKAEMVHSIKNNIEESIPSENTRNPIEEEIEGNVILEEEEIIEVEVQVIRAFAPNNKVVRVNVEYQKPEIFDSESSEKEWMKNAFVYANDVAKAIERGETNYEDLPDEQIILLEGVEEDDEILRIKHELDNEKDFFLQICEIRGSFGITKNSIDFNRCLKALENLNKINLTVCLLLKMWDHFLYVKRLRRYVGNKEAWNLSTEEEEKFDKNKDEVQRKACELYKKCIYVFNGLLPENMLEPHKFWNVFIKCVKEFNSHFNEIDAKNCYRTPDCILKFCEEIRTIENICKIHKDPNKNVPDILSVVIWKPPGDEQARNDET